MIKAVRTPENRPAKTNKVSISSRQTWHSVASWSSTMLEHSCQAVFSPTGLLMKLSSPIYQRPSCGVDSAASLEVLVRGLAVKKVEEFSCLALYLCQEEFEANSDHCWPRSGVMPRNGARHSCLNLSKKSIGRASGQCCCDSRGRAEQRGAARCYLMLHLDCCLGTSEDAEGRTSLSKNRRDGECRNESIIGSPNFARACHGRYLWREVSLPHTLPERTHITDIMTTS